MSGRFEVVWKPYDKKYEGMMLPKYSICAGDNSWYCDNFYIMTPADAIRALIEDKGSDDKLKRQLAIRIVRQFNALMARIEGNQAKPVCTQVTTFKGKENLSLEKIADQIELQMYKNGRLQLDCLAIHRRRVLSQRFEWYLDFLVGSKNVNSVLALVYKYDLKPEHQPKNHNFKSKFQVHNNQVTIIKVPTVTSRDASKVSQDPDGRGIKEFIPGAHMYGGTKHKPAEYLYAEVGHYDLESGHSEEYSKLLVKALGKKDMRPKGFTRQAAKPVEGYIDIYRKCGQSFGMDNIGEKPNMAKKFAEYKEMSKPDCLE